MIIMLPDIILIMFQNEHDKMQCNLWIAKEIFSIESQIKLFWGAQENTSYKRM